MYINRKVIKGGKLKYSFLFYMLLESCFWSLGFIILMSISENLLFSILERKIIPEQFYLAIGAGIWEELLFRVGVIGLMLIFMIKIMNYIMVFGTKVIWVVTK